MCNQAKGNSYPLSDKIGNKVGTSVRRRMAQIKDGICKLCCCCAPGRAANEAHNTPLSAEYIVMTLHDELTVPEGTPLHRTVLKCVFIYLIYGMKVQGISPLDAHARAAGYYPQDRHGYGVGSEGRAFTVLRRQGEAAKRGGGQRESGGGAPGSGRGQRQQGGRRRGRRQQRKGGGRRGSVAEARG